LRGRLSARELERLVQAGAEVEVQDAPATSRIEWPDDSLRDFVLLDVLMHELGHHLLQHEARMVYRRAARTSEHEAFADRFAGRCRAVWLEASDTQRGDGAHGPAREPDADVGDRPGTAR